MGRPAGLALVLAPILSGAAFACSAGAPPSPRPASSVERVELSDLISNPKRHHGKRVRVVGFCHLEFEGNALYSLSADYSQRVYKHGVWLDLDDESRRAFLDLSDRYVLVEATFDANQKGHLGLWSGTLTAVTRMEASSVP